jgi:hypothetical protein
VIDYYLPQRLRIILNFTEKCHLTERNFYRKVVSPKKLEKGHLTETQNLKMNYLTERKNLPKGRFTEKIGKGSFDRNSKFKNELFDRNII